MMSICCVDGISTGRILLHAACCIIHFHLHAAHGWQAPHSYLYSGLFQYKTLACSVGSLADQLSYWMPPAEFRREYRIGGMPSSDREFFKMAVCFPKGFGHSPSSYQSHRNKTRFHS